ncbi:hypothetical protein FACS1894190_11600 [Spirochaetia bacterium]|nr:hypothetical protein FACS1894190_11600 [Spirochaetia bacterium]
MVKTTNESQQHYNDKIRPYEISIAKLLKTEPDILNECRKSPETAAVKLFNLSNDMLNLTSNYLVINGISVSVLNNKNEDALMEAKKSLSKAIIYLENIVTSRIDVPYSDYEENLSELASIEPEKRLFLVKKTGITLDLLENAFGDNSKWRWSFVDLEGRFSAVAKNLLDLKLAFANNDPSSPNYEALLHHTFIVKQLLSKTADRFHDRFEVSTKRPEDLRCAISFLGALKRILVLLNNANEAESITKKIDVWTGILESMANSFVKDKSKNK